MNKVTTNTDLEQSPRYVTKQIEKGAEQCL